MVLLNDCRKRSRLSVLDFEIISKIDIYFFLTLLAQEYIQSKYSIHTSMSQIERASWQVALQINILWRLVKVMIFFTWLLLLNEGCLLLLVPLDFVHWWEVMNTLECIRPNEKENFMYSNFQGQLWPYRKFLMADFGVVAKIQ